METPTNPLLRLADIATIVELTDALDVHVVGGNTFATPGPQQPLKLAADLVV